MTSRATGKVMGGGCGVELFLAFPFGCWVGHIWQEEGWKNVLLCL